MDGSLLNVVGHLLFVGCILLAALVADNGGDDAA
jgi:hypothetical protein